ncbi:hypothetical protein ACIA98_43010 [Streptomyces sp. NPDC051366]|uniref:lipase family protein n=1 Tax=Streptomyces sp. NPDC051366 TaxID=3365652 RepID=UPI0037AEB6DD
MRSLRAPHLILGSCRHLHPGGQVHRNRDTTRRAQLGFGLAARHLSRRPLSAGPPHSPGGALAILTARNLVRRKVLPWTKTTVITYGQPRIGNPQFGH